MSHLALLLEQHAKIGSSAGMAALIGATEGRLCTGQFAVLFEQDAETKRSSCIPTLIGAAVSLHRAGDITPLFEEQTEIGRGGGMAALIGATISRLGRGELPPLREQYSQTERARGIAALVRAPMGVLRGRHVSPVARRRANLSFETIANTRLRHYRLPARQGPIWLTPSSSRRLELHIIRPGGRIFKDHPETCIWPRIA